MCNVDTRLSSDSDRASDIVTTSTLMRLTSGDSVSVASGDSQHQLPYQMMVDDNTSVDRVSCSDIEGLLTGDY